MPWKSKILNCQDSLKMKILASILMGPPTVKFEIDAAVSA